MQNNSQRHTMIRTQALKQWLQWNKRRQSNIFANAKEKLANALQKLWRGGQVRNLLRHAWCGRSHEFSYEVAIDHAIAMFTRPARLSISRYKSEIPKFFKMKLAQDAMMWEEIYKRNLAASPKRPSKL